VAVRHRPQFQLRLQRQGRRGSIRSTARTLAFGSGINGCVGAPRAVALPDRDPTDGIITTRHDHQSCRAPATLLEVQGGGHTWPGAPQYLPTALVGRVSRDFDAREAIAAFFKAL
jgi:polyhydroxybutyrate depolymerase